jgi:hypothetical protein
LAGIIDFVISSKTDFGGFYSICLSHLTMYIEVIEVDNYCAFTIE